MVNEERLQTDILIIVGGAAGLNAAITARQAGLDVIVMDKAVIERSGHFAGGIDHFAALHRKESRFGQCHYRLDFPETDDHNWLGTNCRQSRHQWPDSGRIGAPESATTSILGQRGWPLEGAQAASAGGR